ncbi:hypothetical protein B0H17DRAFT_441011 [Mycena rosella]|uniref:Uncharacterized protein n=1 Tax=Mycena rosella TaxID=1033263 RepID=A0AAD7GHC6_MYCRO|nr:hypothetical protein B0H17DRAFT_441011 [Mycena rosella]
MKPPFILPPSDNRRLAVIAAYLCLRLLSDNTGARSKQPWSTHSRCHSESSVI